MKSWKDGRKTIKLICEECHNEFDKAVSEYNRSSKHFCSLKCSGKNKTKYKNIYLCKECGKEIVEKIFCSHSCAASYSNKNRVISEATKVKIRNTILNKYKDKHKKTCKICGEEVCSNKEICGHMKDWFNNLIAFGFNIETLGTTNIYFEYIRIKNILSEEYYNNKLSPKDIAEKYKYNKNYENVLHILKSFGFITRNISESLTNACLIGKFDTTIKNNKSKYQYKCGWHDTWNGDKIYYRSSYELNFAQALDDSKIYYKSEYFRIKYWDTQKNKFRIAIPDFYILQENKLIEVKSKVTFNKQNLIDKFNEYMNLKFNVQLLLDGVYYSYSEMLLINENKFLLGNN